LSPIYEKHQATFNSIYASVWKLKRFEMRTPINLVIIFFMLAACSIIEFNGIPENDGIDTSDTRVDNTWPPDNYSFGLLYRSADVSFKDIVAVAENAYENSDLNIYLYSGMGDENKSVTQHSLCSC